jgi:hypothetical protein
MIVNHHPLARLKFSIQRPRGVRNDKLFNSYVCEYAHTRRHFPAE